MTDRDTVSQNRVPEDGRGMAYTPSGRIRHMQEAARQRFATAPLSRKGERLREAFFDMYKDAELWERQARAYAHGLTPVNTAGGLTAAMQSYLALDNELMTGGASTMWDMDSAWIDESLLASIYGVFEAGGGQIYQGNMTDVRELEAALEHPERHPELIVRVGGYSARFMNLEKDVRQEIIDRRRWSSKRDSPTK